MFDAPCFALFDDNLTAGGDLLLDGLQAVIRCECIADVDAAFAAIEAAKARGQWVALAASYELGLALEPRLAGRLNTHSGPLLTAWVFERATRLAADETAAALAATHGNVDEHASITGLADLQPLISREAYCTAVERIRDYIHAGDCYQVNYTFPLEGRLYGDPLCFYARLRSSQPVSHGAFIRHEHGSLLSRSPELFVERRGTRLTCRPMKGTAPRESDPQALLDSEKNRAENLMIVDLIRNDLGRLAPAGGVSVDSLFDLEAYPSVWQLTSTVHAESVDADLTQVFRALFPCGSITGAPKIRAMELIDELEPAPRGLYCGALGWIAPNGDFRFSVPIRTIEMRADGRARCGIGSGVVADSLAAEEWAECLLKSRFLSDARTPFALFETLRCEAGKATPLPLLERHLARLAHSAATFGFPCDLQIAREQLEALACMLPAGVHRLKLELAADGGLTLFHAPLDPLPPPQKVCLAGQRVDSTDLLLRHKTTARALYDSELAAAMHAGFFDAVFFNERDELSEGARSAVLIEENARLLTPPLDCGLLDSVYRRLLLDEGRAHEAVIDRPRLLRADKVFVANALRGLIEVELDSTPSTTIS